MTDRPEGADVRLPLFEEVARLDKRSVVTERLRLNTTVREHDERVEAALRSDDVSVETIQLDRVVAEAPQVRQEGDTLIVPVLEEVLVVETRLVLKQEIRIKRRVRTRTEEHTVRLRAEDVQIEHVAATDNDANGGDNHDSNKRES